MIPINFPEANMEIKKPNDMTDEQCSSIYALHDIDTNGYEFFLEAWKPSYEDIQAINRGESIYIKIIHNVLPPVAVFTMDENNNPNI